MERPADDFDAYVRARTPALIRTAYLLTGDQHRAEDLVQDALIKTYRAWSRLRNTNPDAYTRTVMHHLNISWWRRRRSAEISNEQPPDADNVPDEVGRSLNRMVLHKALNQLTPRQRAVIVLRFFEDVTEVDAAQTLGVSIGTIKSTTSRALLKLRAIAPYLLDAEGAHR
jgi:RNA polymerase sigma-70 factor (sigma-E family)